MVSTPDWRSEYPFASHFVDAPSGWRMHYVDEGPRDASPLLFVHGNPTWSFYWRHLITGLRDTFRCVAPDHVGMGLSARPDQDGPWHRLEARIADLCALVERLDLRNLTVVVHDWGGAIGIGMAGRMPERIARLVITNTGAFPSTDMPTRIAACRIPVVGPLAVRGLNGFAGAALHMATEKGLTPIAKAGLLAPYGGWGERIAIQRFVEDIPMSAAHPTWSTLKGVEANLARLAHLPVLLDWGERDWCFTPKFRETFQRHFPAATVIRHDDCGHYLCEDARSELLTEIQTFLTAHPLPGASA